MARVLICDDAIFIRMKIREVLEGAGHVIVGETEDAEEAARLYEKHKPELVTMDLLMKTSGVAGIKRIREIAPCARIIIISVLNEQEAEVIEGIRAGASGLVTKPIREEILLSEVDRVLAKEPSPPS